MEFVPSLKYYGKIHFATVETVSELLKRVHTQIPVQMHREFPNCVARYPGLQTQAVGGKSRGMWHLLGAVQTTKFFTVLLLDWALFLSIETCFYRAGFEWLL